MTDTDAPGTASLSTFGPIDHGSSLRDLVEERLAAAIVSGEMAAGEIFSAPTLAGLFGVSVTPVREAMMNLEKRGFVQTLRNKGFRVTAVSRVDLEEIVELRVLLEPPSMRRLAARYPDLAAHHRRFRELAAHTLQAVQRGDLADYILTDTDFHVGLIDLLGNPRLRTIVLDLRQQTRLVGLPQIRATTQLENTTREHEELLDLLESGDGDAAERLMARHIGHVLGQWSGVAEADVEEGTS